MIIPKLSINWIVVLKTGKTLEPNNAHLKILHEVSIEIEEGVMKIHTWYHPFKRLAWGQADTQQEITSQFISH